MNQNVSTGSSTSTTFGAPAEEISRRAYEIWESEGRPEGCDLRHWLQAEQELSARSTNRGREGSQPGPNSSRNTGTDQPLQGTRAGIAAQRDQKRGSNSPFGAEKSTVAQNQNATKRRPANAPMM